MERHNKNKHKNLNSYTPKSLEEEIFEIIQNNNIKQYHHLNKDNLISADIISKKLVKDYFEKSRRDFNVLLHKYLGIACFSEDVDSILMWSHYSKNHEGYCLEYSTEELKLINYDANSYGLHKVKYNDDLKNNTGLLLDISLRGQEHIIDFINQLSKEKKNLNHITVENFNNSIGPAFINASKEHLKPFTNEFLNDERTRNLIERVSLQKATCWKYENEWRYIIQFDKSTNDVNHFINLTPKCIYLGAKVSDEQIKNIRDAIKESGSQIKLKRMRMSNIEFRLEIDELN